MIQAVNSISKVSFKGNNDGSAVKTPASTNIPSAPKKDVYKTSNPVKTAFWTSMGISTALGTVFGALTRFGGEASSRCLGALQGAALAAIGGLFIFALPATIIAALIKSGEKVEKVN